MKDIQTTGIDKLTASLLFAHSFKLVDKEGNEYEVNKLREGDIVSNHNAKGNTVYIDFSQIGTDFFVLCRPFASLTKTIKYDGDDIVPVELFEIGDESGYEFEFEHGNIKTIGVLKSVAEHNSGYALYYLPSPVTETLLHLHFKPSSLPDECCRFIEG